MGCFIYDLTVHWKQCHLLQQSIMTTRTRYRAPLLDPAKDDANGYAQLGDHFKVLTTGQLAKFAQWSLETSKPVVTLMRGWMIQEDQHASHHEGRDVFFLEGPLPCGLYGGMDEDGRTYS